MWKSIFAAGALLAIASPVTAQDKSVIIDSITATPVNLLPVHMGGRVRSEKRGYSYQWPGVYFETQFTGPSVTMMFDDSANNFNVIVDDKPYMILRKPGKGAVSISLSTGGLHKIRLEKRSETQNATGHFLGFIGMPGAPTPNSTARQIEFIGDSLTVGYGNTSAFTQCTPEEIFETTDSQQGFGVLTAKHFDADYQINAFSGLGMVRNYDGREHPKYHMPMLYDRAIFDDPTPVSQPGWHPQVIVIGIGSNDFSTPVRPDEPWQTEANLRADYVKTYTAFVKTVRARNPGAFILLTTVQGEPEGYMVGADEVFAAIKAGGDTKIDRFTLPALDYTGCNSHPNTRSDAKAAQLYIDYLEKHPQIWQGR